jgi:predicted GIY-YIG superfamily endonuclease
MVLVYLLENARGCTYVGCCNDLAKRLRQHNGELVGGAAQTHCRGPWTVRRTISGFQTRQQALQFEYAWRRVHRRMRPRPPYTVHGRCSALQRLMGLERWSRRAPPAATVNLTVLTQE